MSEPSYVRQTRDAYDEVAGDYADLLRGALDDSVWDRTVLAALAELVQRDGGGPVADVGCGPGRVTAHLRDLGLDAMGVDLSPGMVAVARQDHPGLRFEVGTLLALDLPDAGLAAALAWYSLIHVRPDDRPVALAELHRVLRPGGHLLLAFQVGDEVRRPVRPYGHDVALESHRMLPEAVLALLRRAGFTEVAQLVRAPEGRELTDQAYLLVRRPRA